MATVNKILGQVTPVANTDTALYTAPALTSAEGKLFICNRGSKPCRIYVAVTASGNTLANKDYLVYDRPLGIAETFMLEGVKLATGDFVTVKSSKATVTCSLIGTETA